MNENQWLYALILSISSSIIICGSLHCNSPSVRSFFLAFPNQFVFLISIRPHVQTGICPNVSRISAFQVVYFMTKNIRNS
ncbi:MAG: hypothetical protein KKD31_07030 [Bacteroidetes bacterium]|nr:hypothetical protein [Bacteroidota bacterium]